MKSLLTASCLAASLLLGANAFACEGSTVVFEDQFADDSGGWDTSDDLKFGDGALKIDIGQEYVNLKEMNSGFAVKDADICADIAFPEKIVSVPSAGIMFWAVDYSNFFLFQVSQAGAASLWRLNNSKWFQLYSGDSDAIKKDPGATNHLRITVKGNTITAYVNDTKIRTQKAQAPKGDSQFGLYVQVDEKVPDAAGRTFTATNYKVTDAP